MKKVIILCMVSVLLLASCKQAPNSNTTSQPEPQSQSQSQSQSQVESQSGSSSKSHNFVIPSSVAPTKTGIEGEDEKYPVEIVKGKFVNLEAKDIEDFNGKAFWYTLSTGTAKHQDGGNHIYEIKFDENKMYWNYGIVESEWIHRYSGSYTLVQDGVVEAVLTNEADATDEMNISFHIKVPAKQNSTDKIMQARLLSCSNNSFADMADLLLVYHKQA